ncbi:Ubiquitin-conjugating enzyme E2 E2 [Trametes pubescens]|uniref:E2 ubiquitin-conjugating enzyme n=1 Tax=Trametes pubescens TaxID=154538 RepID=A0A1M2W6T3_TRAPU|nr:Ubiquitin-conjugating enzyme E2 E2 [Trametes pubescens]
MTLKRIHREIADLKKEDLGAIKLSPSDDDLFHWNATIPGPEGSVYEGGVFQVEITLGHDYPFSAPRLAFKTRIYHMNINERGGICIDILKHNWSPALSLFKVILSLSSLLTDPNPKDPLVPSIATEYVRNRVLHDNTARRWTELYARPSAATKGKGKAPAPPVAAPSRPAAPGRSASNRPASRPASTRPTPSRTATPGDTITIDDSDDERPARAAALRTKRKREMGSGAVDIDLSGDGDEVAERPARRARLGTAGAGASGGTGPSEVIVIED